MSETLKFAKPHLRHADSYNAMVSRSIGVDGDYPYNNIDLAQESFAEFVRELEDEAQGIDLPPDIPAQQTYFLCLDEVVIGEFRFRPKVDMPYERYNGHIGYNLHPDYRGQGYGTRGLGLLLDVAREHGLNIVYFTIEGENPASVRVIEKNGGRLEKIVTDDGGNVTQCYYVKL